MQGSTNANKNLLQKVGITVGADGKLSLDEDTFKKADMGTAKSLFNGTGSYGWQVSAQASWIDFAATNEANKANTYNAKGGYGNNYSSGDIFNTYW
jgi:flagellar capping protein FliD